MGTGVSLLSLRVAPLVGAWIEIVPEIALSALQAVAPLVGAWIEILLPGLMRALDLGRAPRGRVD